MKMSQQAGSNPRPHDRWSTKLQLYDAIYRLRFYSNSLIHILSLSTSHNNVASIQKNRGDKSHRVIVALGYRLQLPNRRKIFAIYALVNLINVYCS